MTVRVGLKYFILFILLAMQLYANVNSFLTKDEIAFIKANPVIRISTLKNYYPYDITDKYNKHSGFHADIIDEINRNTGLNLVALPFKNWTDVYQYAVDAKVHGIIGLSWSQEREDKYFHYSYPYHFSTYSVIVHKDNDLITDIEDIEGKIILARKNSITISLIKKYVKDPKIIEFDSIEEIYQQIELGKGDLFLDAENDIEKLSSKNLKIATQIYDKSGELFIGVNHKYKILQSIINKGLNQIPLEKMIDLKQKWFGKKELKPKIYLTSSQKNYLKNKKMILICTKQSSPYIMLGDEQLVGLSADMFRYYEKTIDVPIETVMVSNIKECEIMLRNNEVDLVDNIVGSRFKKRDSTQGYVEDFLVLTTIVKKPYIDDLSNIKHMKVSVNKDLEFLLPRLQREYPTIEFLLVNSTKKGLMGLTYENFYAHIDLHKTIAWMIQKEYLGQMKISGALRGYDVKKVLTASKDNKNNKVLLTIFDKVLIDTKSQTKRSIENSWVNTVKENGFDYVLFFQIMLLFTILFVIAIYFNYELKKQVASQIQKNKKQQDLLFQQTKLASMGEMLNSIAHQWRQPLNRINSNVAVIYAVSEDEMIHKKIKDIENNTKYMSETIEDFSNFSQPDKKKMDFSIKKAIDKAISLLESRINDVKIEIKVENDIKINGFEKEFIQVVLVILNNSLDNFIIQNSIEAKIIIKITKKKNSIQISIEDNGGGIKDGIIDKIFDPYFTTKFSRQGRGIGLYMSKMICENSMRGSLEVQNTKSGAKFIISLN